MKKVLVVFLVIVLVSSFSLTTVSAAPKKPANMLQLNKVVLIHHAKGGIPGPPTTPPEEPENVYTNYKLSGNWDMAGIRNIGPDNPLAWLVNNNPYSSGVPYNFNANSPWGIPRGINFSDAENAIISAYEAWDEATTTELFSYGGQSNADPSMYVPDGLNVICWWGIVPRDIIGQTILWFYNWDGSIDPVTGQATLTEGDELLDCDIMLNALLKWSIEPNRKTFHLQNIVIHEVGHVIGLGDLYADEDSEMTMYGYSQKSETKKCTLEEGDWVGCGQLYGSVTWPYESPRD